MTADAVRRADLGPWRRSDLAMLALLCLGVWLNAADTLVTATIMPSVAAELGGYAYFAWATAGYMLGSIIAGASAGRVSQRFGLGQALAGSALAYAAGCVFSAVAANIAVFLAGRLLQGLGAGWIVGLCYVAIRRRLPERLWASIFATIAGVWGVATVLGPLVGGVFASLGLWRGAFWAFAVQAMAFAVAAPIMMRPPRRPAAAAPIRDAQHTRTAFALPQLGTLTAAIALIAVGGLVGRPIWAALMVVAGLSLIGVLLRMDKGSSAPLLPRGAGDLNAVAGSGFAMMFALSAAAIVFSVYGPALLQAMDGVSPLTAGYVIASESVGWTLCAFAVAHLAPRRHSPLIRAGAGVALAGVIAVALALPTGSLVLVGISGLVLGSGFGLFWAFAARRILASLPDGEGTIGASALPTVQLAGNATGAAIAGVLANLLGLSRAFTAAAAHGASFWLFAAFVPVAAFGCFAAARLARHEPADGRSMAGVRG